MSKINVRDRNKNKPDKKPNWEYRFESAKIGGKRKNISKAGFKTKKEALEAGTKALAEYNNAGLHFEPSEISVSDYLDLFFEQNCKINFKYNTQLGYRSIIDLHLKPYFGVYKLKSITAVLVQDYANKLSLRGYSRSYTNGILSVLNVALTYAVHPLCLIQSNPMQYVKFPRNGKKRRERTVIQPDEFKAIIKRFPFGNRFYIPLLIGWHCGLRISETFALTWNDIDFDNKTLTVNKQMIKRNFAEDPRTVAQAKGKKEEKCGWYFADPKFNSVRTIKIDNILLGELKKEKARQEENEKLYGDFYTIHVLKKETDEKGCEIYRLLSVSEALPTTLPRAYMVTIDENGTYTSADSFKYPSRVIHTQMQLNFDYHSLRHTHATLLIENGVTPKLVQQRLGHRDITTTLQTYVHVTDAIQNEAIEKFEEILNTQINKGS